MCLPCLPVWPACRACLQGHLLAAAGPGSAGLHVWDVATGTATPISVSQARLAARPALPPTQRGCLLHTARTSQQPASLARKLSSPPAGLPACLPAHPPTRPPTGQTLPAAGGPRACHPAALVPLRHLPAGSTPRRRLPHLADPGAAGHWAFCRNGMLLCFVSPRPAELLFEKRPHLLGAYKTPLLV